jgi:hypothetical protein
MPDVKNLNDVPFDREQDSVNVRLASVQELPDLHRRVSILGSHRTA